MTDLKRSKNRIDYSQNGFQFPGNMQYDSNNSPSGKKNRHISPLEHFEDSEEFNSLLSYQPSPSPQKFIHEEESYNYSTPYIKGDYLDPNDFDSSKGQPLYEMSEIYSTMKVHHTPYNDEDSKQPEMFPQNSIIEALKDDDKDIQQFDLITYDKDVITSGSKKHQFSKQSDMLLINDLKVSNKMSKNGSRFLREESHLPAPRAISNESHESEATIKIVVNEKLMKHQNGIIKNLRKDITTLKKKLDTSKVEQQELMNRLIEKEKYDDHEQRKDLIEFCYRNEGKMILFSTAIKDMICKLVINNNSDNQELLELKTMLEK